MCCSTTQLNAAAAAATSQMPAVAASAVFQSGRPGHREQHADHGAEHDQLHHPRLGQRIELADARRGRDDGGGGAKGVGHGGKRF
jgi:hypothetical protein